MQSVHGECPRQYPAVGYVPVSLARIAPFVGFLFVYAAAYQVTDARFNSLPRFPYTHADSAAKPLVYLLDFVSHIGQIVIFRPPSQVLPQGGFAPGIPHAVASRSDGFEAAPQFGFGFLMQPQAAFPVADIKAVAEEFLSTDVGDFGLFSVDLESEVSLYKLGDTLFDAFGRSFAPTND